MNILSVDEIKKLKVVKYRVLQDFLFFTRYFYKSRFGRKFEVAEPHILITQALERVLKGETTRLIINIAPRYGKTEIAVKNLIACGLALNPSAKFIHLTYSSNLALDNSSDAKDLVNSEAYQQLFLVKIRKDSKSKEKWYTEDGGGVYAAASGGQVTGFGAGKVDDSEVENDLELVKAIEELEFSAKTAGDGLIELKKMFAGAIIIDDPIKPEDAISDIKRTRINDRFETTIRNRVNSRKTPIIIIQQRTHPNDLSGYLMDIEPGEWEVLRLPCLREDGTALWDLKHTVDELLKIKRINPYVFESQYQQNPQNIRKGGEFWKLYSDVNNVIDNPVVSGIPKLYNPSIPLHLTFDFNTNPHMTLCVHQLQGKKSIQIDEICQATPKNTTEATCDTFLKRYYEHKSGIYIYGDPNGHKEDTRSEVGHNDYKVIMRILDKFRPEKRVFTAYPPVAMRGRFINACFDINFAGIEIFIGSNCVKTRNDYLFGKEKSDGTKLKETFKDPSTGITCEKYHHCTDANDYYFCKVFADEFAEYQSGGKSFAPMMGGGRARL